MIGLYAAVFRAVFKLKLWLPFIVYALLQIIVLIVCRSYVNPYIYPILSPIVSLIEGNNAQLFGHYPGLFLLMPSVMQWLRLALGILFEGLAIGLTAVLFIRQFGTGNETMPRLSATFSKWPQLLIVWTIITAIIVALNLILPKLLAGFLIGSPRRIAVFDVALRLLGVIIYSIFIYAVPSIIVYKNSIMGAFRTSLSFFARFPIFSFFLAFLPFILTVPTTYFADKANLIVSKFSPELVFYVLLAGIIIDMIVNYIMTGTVVKFLIDEKK